jgi:hypothetical protein
VLKFLNVTFTLKKAENYGFNLNIYTRQTAWIFLKCTAKMLAYLISGLDDFLKTMKYTKLTLTLASNEDSSTEVFLGLNRED